MAEMDLLDLLLADHRNLLEGRERNLVAAVSQHLSVERDLLYPAIREFCLDGEEIVEGLRHSERALEERLSDLEAAPTAEHQSELDQALRDHAAMETHLFPELRRVIPGWRLVEVLDTVPISIGGSPTHAHPRLAEGGPMGEVVEDVTSVADRLRDRAQHQK